MGRTTERRRTRAGALAPFLIVLGLAAGCASEDFPNQPRPPAPLQLTGVIKEDGVEISPDEVGTGPVVIRISNQTEMSHTVTLVGQGVDESVGPVNPLDTAVLQKSLVQEGVYRVEAGSEVASASIPPGRLVVGRGRQSSRDDLQVP